MSVNNDNFLIEINDIELAQSKVSRIADDTIRSRAVANTLAALLASKYFGDIEIDIRSGIHNIAKVLENIDISDVYIKGNFIDVRVFFNDNELFVPKSHFEMEMLPVAYMFIKLDKDLSTGNIAGFIFPEDIDTENDINGYYKADEENLKSFYDTEQRIAIVDDDDIDNEFKKNVYNYLDGKTSGENIYKKLVSSLIARDFLANAASADFVFDSLNLEDISNNDNHEADNIIIDSGNSNYSMSESDELVEVEPTDNIELVEQPDSELADLTEVGESDLNIETDEFPESLDEGDNFELIDEYNPDDTDLSTDADDKDETEVLSETAAEDLPERTEEEIRMEESPIEYSNSSAEEDAYSDIIDTEPEELEIEEEQLVENMDFSYDFETSGQLSKNIPANQLKPRLVVVHDDSEPDNDANDDEFKELSKFDYSTEIMPSISSIESDSQDSPVTEEMLAESERVSENTDEKQQEFSENKEQIENLFGQNPHKAVNTKKKKGSPIPFLGFIIVLAALGYYGYTKFYSPMPDVINNTVPENSYENITADNVKKTSGETAMPVETVENVQVPKSKDEAAAVSIPAIEQNLNASIDVSNLSVNWEVPLSYANNTTAKRYFVKIGKILQLNLKTELLFLSNSPITNKISIELEFDKNSNKFGISKFIDSSGIMVIDNTIRDTVERALNMNLNTNMSVFKNLQGSPILVIKL